MRKQRVILILGAIAVIGAALWYWSLVPSYDVRRVEPRLTALQKPYRLVRAAYYMDGGSIGIEITDRDGKVEPFAIPAHIDEGHAHELVYAGSMYDREPGAVLVADSEQTKRMLIAVLASEPEITPENALCLLVLRHHPADFLRCIGLKYSGAFDPSPIGNVPRP